MNYSAPDFVKVAVNVKDSFAAYSKSCPMDEKWIYNYTAPCQGTEEWNLFHETYVQKYEKATYQCYSTYNE